ncbi:MAG: hypothetical protein ACK5TC_02565 [bacterium]
MTRTANRLHENGLGTAQPSPFGRINEKFMKTSPKTGISIALYSSAISL